MWLCAQWRLRSARGIRPVWSESLLCAQWVAKGTSFLHADSEDSDQTWRKPRLIWVFAGRTCDFVGFVTRRLITVGLSSQFLITHELSNKKEKVTDTILQSNISNQHYIALKSHKNESYIKYSCVFREKKMSPTSQTSLWRQFQS